jgi:hypothetical protein
MNNKRKESKHFYGNPTTNEVIGCTIEDFTQDIMYGNSFDEFFTDVLHSNSEREVENSDLIDDVPYIMAGLLVENEGKSIDNTLTYSHKVLLTFDCSANEHLQDKDMIHRMKAKFRTDKFIELSFIPYYGVGLNVVVNVSSDLVYHDIAQNQVAKYFLDKYALVDDGYSGLFTKCSLSIDGDPIYNPNSETFKVKLPK